MVQNSWCISECDVIRIYLPKRDRLVPAAGHDMSVGNPCRPEHPIPMTDQCVYRFIVMISSTHDSQVCRIVAPRGDQVPARVHIDAVNPTITPAYYVLRYVSRELSRGSSRAIDYSQAARGEAKLKEAIVFASQKDSVIVQPFL